MGKELLSRGDTSTPAHTHAPGAGCKYDAFVHTARIVFGRRGGVSGVRPPHPHDPQHLNTRPHTPPPWPLFLCHPSSSPPPPSGARRLRCQRRAFVPRRGMCCACALPQGADGAFVPVGSRLMLRRLPRRPFRAHQFPVCPVPVSCVRVSVACPSWTWTGTRRARMTGANAGETHPPPTHTHTQTHRLGPCGWKRGFPP